MSGVIVPEWVLQLITPLVGTAAGALLGYKLAIRSHVAQKRHDFIVEQLRDFYSPMLALRAEIALQMERCFDYRNDHLSPEDFFRNVWPLYRKMATQFSTHLWLASPDTRSHYRAVVKVIETFDLSIENQMIDERYMSEETKAFDSLQPFYTHLEAKLDELQRKLIPKT